MTDTERDARAMSRGADVLPDWLASRAASSPHGIALIAGGRAWSFHALDAEVTRTATGLAELGVRYVMTGHPERRRLFGEGPKEFNRKVLVTAEVGMVPILVVGEPERIGDPGPLLREQLAQQARQMLLRAHGDSNLRSLMRRPPL